MNVQPMTLDLNSLRAPQKLSNQQVSNKKEDEFSSVLEKSRKNQETPVKAKENKAKEDVTPTSKEKETIESSAETATESKDPVTKETDKSKETKLEDQVLVKEENEKVIQAIADLLGIAVPELEQMLATLQIEMSDLLKGDNLQQLIMQVHGVEEPMDLLLIPEVASEIKVISSMLEEHSANTVVRPDQEVLQVAPQQVEAGQAEAKVNPETQVATGAQQKNVQQASTPAMDNAVLEVDPEQVSKLNVTAPNNEKSAQNEEQSTPNQNNAASQFLDHLSQSMGEVFQTQNNQVNETFETIATRNEVVNPRMVLDQIVERIKVSSLKDEALMSIQLKPEHLGKLSMEVISKQGIMTAHFVVENEKTKAMLEQNIQSLRDSLEDKGLVIQELEVTVGQNQNDDKQTYQSPKSNRNISDIINGIMNEDLLEEETQANNRFKNEENEVDFIA
ncbi:MAG TPA: hypothetical protein GX707_02425 [Epulopiscium sp.]|nr:hypothetical protein [Candidatus Epulonipiscium sp.]